MDTMTKELVGFYRRFAALLSSSVPILKALDTVSDEIGNTGLGDALRSIRNALEAGEALNAAMEKHPDYFPPTVCTLVKKGELEGHLDKTIKEIAEGHEDGSISISAEVRERPDVSVEGADLVAAEAAPVIRMVNMILVNALKMGASDIHIEKTGDKARLRYRVDGRLQEGDAPSDKLYNQVVSRIKIMSDLNVSERRIPQDGRFKIKALGKEADMRVCITPTIHGESVVMRLLDKGKLAPDLAALGYPEDTYNDLRWCLEQPHGIVVVGGPTGSGKTTLLYAMLQELVRPDSKIISIEDPVEYQIDGVTQMQIHAAVGFTFGSALRAALRQDPDIILLGEIRDSETAEIAVKAALTGHLVLTSMHFTDSAAGVSRLMDLVAEPFLLSASLLAMCSQRLVRKVCPDCREEYEPGEPERELDPDGRIRKFYRAKGCDKCYNGYRGRGAILEVLKNDPRMSKLIRRGAEEDAIRKQAIKSGMKTMKDVAVDMVSAGKTTLEAARAVVDWG